MFLKGQNIALRALEPSDAGLLYEWENDVSVWPVSYTQIPFSKFILEEFINTAYQDIYTSKQLRLMMADPVSGETLGILDLFEFDPQHARVGLGIYVHPAHRGTGIASEALELAKSYCRDVLFLNQIYVHVDAANEASIRLFEQAGFKKAGLKQAWTRTAKDRYSDTWFLQHLFDRT